MSHQIKGLESRVSKLSLEKEALEGETKQAKLEMEKQKKKLSQLKLALEAWIFSIPSFDKHKMYVCTLGFY